METSEVGPRYREGAGVSTNPSDRVARSAGVVGAATLASRITGLLRDVVFARAFDAGATDAFFIAFTIPNLFRRLVAEGSLTVSFVPIFGDWLRRSRDEARHVFHAVWTLAALVGLAITLGGIAFAGPLIGAFAPGFALVPGKHELAVYLLRWCFPYILLLTLVAVAMGAQNALGRFFAPAIAPVLLNVAMIGGAICGVLWFDPPILAMGGAVVVAGLLQVWLQLPALRSLGFAPRATLALGHPAVRRLGVVMLPAVLGASVFQINVLVSRFLSSFFGDGAVSYLYYADRLLEFPLGVFVFALGTASLPSFAGLVRSGDRAALERSFADTLLLTAALVLPSAAGLALLAQPIFRALFGFEGEAAAGCALALHCYLVGLPPIAIARIYTGLCLAHENTRTAAHAAVVALLANVVFSLMLIGPLPAGALPDWATAAQHRIALADLDYAGLALAASLASLANALYLVLAVRARYGRVLPAGVAGRAARLFAGCVGLALAVAAAGWPFGADLGPALEIAALAARVAAGAAAYAAVLFGLRSPELTRLVSLARRSR
jgi:putative peptidoglycan lipid II flippase